MTARRIGLRAKKLARVCGLPLWLVGSVSLRAKRVARLRLWSHLGLVATGVGRLGLRARHSLHAFGPGNVPRSSKLAQEIIHFAVHKCIGQAHGEKNNKPVKNREPCQHIKPNVPITFFV